MRLSQRGMVAVDWQNSQMLGTHRSMGCCVSVWRVGHLRRAVVLTRDTAHHSYAKIAPICVFLKAAVILHFLYALLVCTALKINRLSSVDKSALCVHPACTVSMSGGESALVAVSRAACLCTHSLFRGVPLRIFCIGGASKRLLRQKFLPPVSVFPHFL